MKVLLFSYTFPPVSGFSPARVARLATCLAERGHELRIITTDRPPGYSLDPDSLRLASDELNICRVTPRPSWMRMPGGKGKADSSDLSIPRRLSFYRRYLKPWVFPDSTFPWLRPARRALNLQLETFKPDVIYSFAFPFSTHLLGEYAARKTGAAWIMDYGDPWSVSPTWSVPQWRKHFDKRIEKRMLKRAAAAVFTTGETAEAYRSAFEGLPRGGGLHVSRCAFDPASFEDLKSAGKSAGKFRLVYTGIYGMVNRNIQGLLDSLAGLERDDWELHLAGVDNSENENSLAGYLSQLGIDAQVHQHGQLPLAEALSLQKSADLLLLWGWPGGMQIPAKVYEYIAVERPIMLIRGDVHDASESLVREGPRGISVAADRDFLSKALNTILEDWSTGRWEAQFNLKRDMRFSWDAQISILADIFESVNRAD